MANTGLGLNVNISVSDGTQKFLEGQVLVKRTAFFNKQVKRHVARYASVRVLSEGAFVAYSMTKLMNGVSSAKFAKRGKDLLDVQLKETLRAKFNTRGFGKWRALKPSTVKKRIWMTKVQAGTSDTDFKKALTADRPIFAARRDSPLIFTGKLRAAAIAGHSITEFKFFNRKDYRAGKLGFEKLDIAIGFKEPDIKAPRWYWMKGKGKTFKEVMNFQSKFRPIPLQAGRIKDSRDITAEFTRSEQFRRLWSPFVKNQFPKMFKGADGRTSESDVMALLGRLKKEVSDKLGAEVSEIDSALKRFGLWGKVKSKAKTNTNAALITKMMTESLIKAAEKSK